MEPHNGPYTLTVIFVGPSYEMQILISLGEDETQKLTMRNSHHKILEFSRDPYIPLHKGFPEHRGRSPQKPAILLFGALYGWENLFGEYPIR